jgi:hypothetical protein
MLMFSDSNFNLLTLVYNCFRLVSRLFISSLLSQTASRRHDIFFIIRKSSLIVVFMVLYISLEINIITYVIPLTQKGEIVKKVKNYHIWFLRRNLSCLISYWVFPFGFSINTSLCQLYILFTRCRGSFKGICLTMDSWIKLFFTTDSTNLTDGNKVVDGA